MQTKSWGQVLIENLKDVDFKVNAFDQLVLEPKTKKIIKALVEHQSSETFSDIVSGKGGGCIFLLHGPPGVGKTTSAEAVAEVLKRPLYSVTVGELGTDAKTLEKSLTRLLQIAGRWNAVILLDEADIFLETRTDNDVLRNAMVGIFLRLLEYHQGVMFLTTNRVKRFDPAFHSRISVALHYDEFDTKTRKQVWTNLLKAANLDDLAKKHAEELSLCKLNGRQIRTTIRMALSLAVSDNTSVSFQHIKETIELTQKFSDYLEFVTK